MGRRGPKPTPTALKILRGNPGHRPINADEPQPKPAKSLRPPAWLDPKAARIWRELGPRLHALGLLTDAALWRRLSGEARACSVELAGVESIAARWRQHLQAVLAAPRGTGRIASSSSPV